MFKSSLLCCHINLNMIDLYLSFKSMLEIYYNIFGFAYFKHINISFSRTLFGRTGLECNTTVGFFFPAETQHQSPPSDLMLPSSDLMFSLSNTFVLLLCSCFSWKESEVVWRMKSRAGLNRMKCGQCYKKKKRRQSCDISSHLHVCFLNRIPGVRDVDLCIFMDIQSSVQTTKELFQHGVQRLRLNQAG